CAGIAGEALTRRLAEPGRAEPGRAEEPGTPPGLPCAERPLRAGGEALGRARARLEAADAACFEVRSETRRLRRRRDAATRELYREMGRVRRAVKAAVGAERLREYLPKGDTQREPWHLLTQAGHVLELLADSPQPLDVRGENGARVCGPELVERLRSLVARSEAALRAVAAARRREEAALVVKQRATAAFDRSLKATAHRLEAALDAGGLFSLADAVRPWTGRRGRPPKQKPVDLYPDLVARAMADLPVWEAAPATPKVAVSTLAGEVLTPKEKPSAAPTAEESPIVRLAPSPPHDAPRIERFRRRQRTTGRRSAVTSRRRRSFDSRCPSREKSNDACAGRWPGVGKIEKRVRGPEPGAGKIEHRLRGWPSAREEFVNAFRGLRPGAGNRLVARIYEGLRARV
ncbi:MAG: hypothetical protein GY719_17375, partial [bacterium]|nr:hypothetical protein [bacterium]